METHNGKPMSYFFGKAEKLKFKKLVSLNPDEYKEISLSHAVIGYDKYLFYFFTSDFFIEGSVPKTFNEWLLTEI